MTKADKKVLGKNLKEKNKKKQLCVVDGESQEKTKSKSKKHNIALEENVILQPESGDDHIVFKKKEKRKGKIQAETELTIPNSDNVINPGGVNVKKKKKKVSLPDEENAHQLTLETSRLNTIDDTVVPDKQEKKKHRKKDIEDPTSTDESLSTKDMKKRKKKDVPVPIKEDDPTPASTVCIDDTLGKKKRRKEEISTNGKSVCQTEDTRTDASDNVCISSGSDKVKKKKKKVKFLNNDEDEPCGVSENNVNFQETESVCDPNKTDFEQVQQDHLDTKSKEVSKKKKKRHMTKEESDLPIAYESVQDDSGNKERKEKTKKKKKNRELVEDLQNAEKDHADEADVPKKKKKRKNEIESAEKIKPPKKKKRNVLENNEVTEGKQDEEFVPEKKAASVKIPIDTVKRQALQDDIDRESGKIKDARFGQWDTASFQCSEQKDKFLRLLGGFKKGNQAAFTKSPSQQKANMALGKTEETALNRNLQEEFDKALNWKQSRGSGLGFQPPAPKKTFFIDKTASKSIKFDD
ncbi:lysine-rich nucleolar protein 1 [Bombina bombina]|uniref:lysine-rich nucleolar protein 1 n=1 Tax=Bombina bombina TaxID=8345 RepID=UPI00235AD3D3|nr:lysine-rich nucleolar protein 1 [Bombina bombina]